MKTTLQNRDNSYRLIQLKFSEQEKEVLIQINLGVNNFADIVAKTGMDINSVKRALHYLSADEVPGKTLIKNGMKINYYIKNEKKILMESGSKTNQDTGHSITCYRMMSEYEFDKFHNTKQTNIF